MIIIARYNEDISWAKGKEYTVIQKGEHLINYGREPLSFLWYIIQNYDDLTGWYQFLQGKPFDHYPFVDNPHETSKFGCPHHPNLPFKKFLDESGVELPERWKFYPGGQFSTSAIEIKKHPKEFYENLYRMIEEDELIAWVLERAWQFIFSIV